MANTPLAFTVPLTFKASEAKPRIAEAICNLDHSNAWIRLMIELETEHAADDVSSSQVPAADDGPEAGAPLLGTRNCAASPPGAASSGGEGIYRAPRGGNQLIAGELIPPERSELAPSIAGEPTAGPSSPEDPEPAAGGATPGERHD